MHKGRPFEIDQRLRLYAPNDLYSAGWPARSYTMTTGTYGGSLAGFVTDPTPLLEFQTFDPDFLGGYYLGVIGNDGVNDLAVGFHFRLNATSEDSEGWVQTFISGAPCLNEPTTGQNHLPFIWNAVSLFPSTSTGPHWAELHPDHVVWDPTPY